MGSLTEQEIAVIKKLNHSLYTVEFINERMGRRPENVLINAPAALQQMGVEGFMDAVRCMVKESL